VNTQAASNRTFTSSDLNLTPSSGAPDWASVTLEVKCPLCEYNLRGLAEPLCPECGYRFEWRIVLDPSRRIHPYLFEHHPERNVGSFLQTLLRNFRPFQFWKTLEPSQPSSVRRLMIYWAVGALAAMLPAVVVIAWEIQRELRWARLRPTSTSTLDYVTTNLVHNDLVQGVVFGCLIWAAYPLLNFLTLLVFVQSMRQAKVRAAHVLRCAIYSGDIILWYGLFATCMAGWLIAAGSSFRRQHELVTLLFRGALIAVAINFVRLVVAYRRYLRFSSPIATILASQAIVILAIFVIFVYAFER
jgi:hypothetical protein